MHGRTSPQYGQTYFTAGVLDSLTRNETRGHINLTPELKLAPFSTGNWVKDLIRRGHFGVCLNKLFLYDINIKNSLYFESIVIASRVRQLGFVPEVSGVESEVRTPNTMINSLAP